MLPLFLLNHLDHAAVVFLEFIDHNGEVPLILNDILLEFLTKGQALGQTAIELVLEGDDVLLDHAQGLTDGHHSMLAMGVLLVHTVGAQGLTVNLAIQGQDGVVVETSLGGFSLLQGLHALDGGLYCPLEVLLYLQDLSNFGRVRVRFRTTKWGWRRRTAAGW